MARKKTISELGAAAMKAAKETAPAKKASKKTAKKSPRKKAAKKAGTRRKKATKRRASSKCDPLSELRNAASVIKKAKAYIKEADAAASSLANRRR